MAKKEVKIPKNYTVGMGDMAQEVESDFNLDLVERIMSKHPSDRDALGYSSQVLARCTFPYKELKEKSSIYTKANGPYVMTVAPGHSTDSATLVSEYFGVPFGKMPRLIMIYICTQIKQNKLGAMVDGKKVEPVIKLGDYMGDFLKRIGFSNHSANRKKLTGQAMRLFMSSIQLEDLSNKKCKKGVAVPRMATSWEMWNANDTSHNPDLITSQVTLDESFCESVRKSGFPVDLDVLKEIHNDALAIDMYLWLSLRMYEINLKGASLELSWGLLNNQFKMLSDTRNFARNARASLTKIKTYWPGLNIDLDVKGKLIIHPSPLQVPQEQEKISE